MRILVDYRAALRARTGVGAYIHELLRAYTASFPDDVAVFTSSWKDRPAAGLARELGVRVVDRRIPVRLLNLLWHRTEWPPAETLAGPVDVVHSAHPLLMPARGAAQVVTIHDLFFLTHPEGTRAEIRRDYPALAAAHARRADGIITSTQHGKDLLRTTWDIEPDRIYVCGPGAPVWRSLGQTTTQPVDGVILFVGTLEPRKNVGALLDAYETLLGRVADAPGLVLAGQATAAAAPWLARIRHAPLAGKVTHLGYVPDADREALYARARVLVLPSHDEGFGLPVLEAMSAGIPVIASRRGALPEVVGDAGMLFDPDRPEELVASLEELLTDPVRAAARAHAGLTRAAAFSWAASAETLRRAYIESIERRRRRGDH